MPSIIVVGAGWAGLQCAYTLTKAGQKVTLIDAAPQSGGRARSVPFQNYTVDNGQHICLGAYDTLRQVLHELKLDEQKLFHILPMEIIAHGKERLHLRLPNLPAPLHLLVGLLVAGDLALTEKYRTLKFCYQLRKAKFILKQDCTLLELLQHYKQSDFIIKYLWEPLALAAMTTPINIASAQVFLNILRLIFTASQQASNWYLPATDLSALLPDHIESYLTRNGSEVIHAQSIKSLISNDNRCVGVNSNTRTWQADNVVLAIAPWQALPLIEDLPILTGTHQALSSFNYQPITTLYFEFATPVALPYPMIGMLDSTCHWVFDRAFSAQPNIISVVISGSGAHQNLTQNELFNTVLEELKQLFPELPKLLNQRVINEKRAAFNCSVEIQKHRPHAATALANLWLTGDYLSNGLPATLEGSLLNGKSTAGLILATSS